MLGNEAAVRRCRDHGVVITRAQGESINSAGGAAVIDDFHEAIIAVRETAGVFRRHAQVIPMASDVTNWPRRSGGVSVNFTAENTVVTTTQMSFDAIALVAKKIAGLVLVGSELAEDSVIGEILSTEIGYEFAVTEDLCGFTGTGTSAYGGIRGLTSKILDGTHTSAVINAASGHSTFAELTTADLSALVGGVMAAALPSACWYASQYCFAATFCNLSEAIVAGDVTVGATNRPTFWGFPIVPVPSLPQVSTSLTSKVMMLFGDLAMSSAIGERRSDIKILRERFADSDQLGILATERFDINCHDLGSNTTVGPIAALVGG